MEKLKNNRPLKRALITSLTIIFLAVVVIFTISKLSRFVDKAVSKTEKIGEYNLLAQNLLGLNGKKNILLLFMNNAEQRYGGGFIGSVGYVSVDGGKIKPDPVRNVYYYDYDFGRINYVEKSPDPKEGEVLYSLKDSGQSLNWPSNGKRAKEIFEKQSGKEVDSVVAITPEILKYLIKKTGPIKLDDYKVTITENNIIETIQKEVEYGKDKRKGKDPKTILTSVFNVLVNRLSQKSIKDLNELAMGLGDLSKSRQIIVYSKDYEFSRLLEKYSLDGSLVSTTKDYSVISEKNVSIDKSNGFIDRELKRTVTVKEDGSVEVEMKIIRNQNIPISFPYVDPHAPDVVTNLVKENKSYIKLALPAKSMILNGDGFTPLEYRGQEAGYDVYGFQSDLVPLSPSEYYFKYRLPYKLAWDKEIYLDSYFQYPNGGWPYKITNEVIVPNGWKFKSSNKNLKDVNGRVYYNELVDRDVELNIVYEKK